MDEAFVYENVEVHCRATLHWQVRPTPYPAKGDLPGDVPAHTHFRHLQAAAAQGRRRGTFLYFNHFNKYFNNNPPKKYFASDSLTDATK